jgi:hypothetical protein
MDVRSRLVRLAVAAALVLASLTGAGWKWETVLR